MARRRENSRMCFKIIGSCSVVREDDGNLAWGRGEGVGV